MALVLLLPLTLTPSFALTVAAATAAVVVAAVWLRGRAEAWVLAAAAVGGVAATLSGVGWQAVPAVALVTAVVAWCWVRRGPSLAARIAAALRPRLDGASIALAVTTTVVAGAFLLVYFDQRGTFTFTVLPPLALVLIPLGNALLEEGLWRGASAGLLVAGRVPTVAVVVLQAVSFGLAHWSTGFPSGWSGAVASTVFGLAVGLLAVRTRSLVLPIVVHWAVDMVIFFALFR